MISWSNSLPKENTIITKKIYAINGAQLYQYVCHEQYPPVVLVRVRKKDLHHILKKDKRLKGSPGGALEKDGRLLPIDH